MEHKEAVKKYFDDLSLDYQKAYELDANDPLRTYIFRERKEIVLGLIDKQGGRLLDIGCGPAVMTKELLNKNFLVYNTDTSNSMIELARQSLSGHEHIDKVFFQVCDIDDLVFESSYFDVVLCVGVLEYLPDHHRAISKISKFLKKDGIAIISLPNKLSLFNFIDDLLSFLAFKICPNKFNSHKSMRCHGIGTKRFVHYSFIKELEKYGLKQESTKFHIYTLACLRKFFPNFCIILSKVLGKVDLFLLAPLFANNCIIKFRKERDV